MESKTLPHTVWLLLAMIGIALGSAALIAALASAPPDLALSIL